DEFSKLKLRVVAPDKDSLTRALEELVELGCYQAEIANALVRPALADCVVPEDFYSSTNHRTFVKHEGAWLEVGSQRMDAVIVIEEGLAECRKLREVRAGDRIVCGVHGVRIQPEFKE